MNIINKIRQSIDHGTLIAALPSSSVYAHKYNTDSSLREEHLVIYAVFVIDFHTYTYMAICLLLLATYVEQLMVSGIYIIR